MNENDFEDVEESDVNSHGRLVEAINQLDKTQYIKKPTRTGYSENKSEFNVPKSLDPKGNVAVKDIIKILQKSTEHADAGKKLKAAQKNAKTLHKPIEKHQAERIKRSTGFEDVKNKLDRWDAIVTRNRSLDHQVFPIEKKNTNKPMAEHLSKYKLKSELEISLDTLTPAVEEPEEQKFPLTMNEMIEHRKEAAKLRAKQSYQEAKARRQSKIKSKKFHRIQRKQKIKQQLKDFEILQKTDPEEALRKLEQLEKTRAEERVTLRHKSTGQWAKNKLVRAKYNKETRQELAQQLAISRELTQKLSNNQNSDSEEDIEVLTEPMSANDSSNPWLSNIHQEAEVSEFLSSYKKYWNERNKPANNDKMTEKDKQSLNDSFVPIEDVPAVKNKTSNMVKINKKLQKNEKKPEASKNKSKVQKIIVAGSEWDIELLAEAEHPHHTSLAGKTNDLVKSKFEDFEFELQDKLSRKLNKLKNEIKNTRNHQIIEDKKTHSKKSNHTDLSFKKKKNKPLIDEELQETSTGISQATQLTPNLKFNEEENNTIPNGTINTITKIDPNKFTAMKPRHLLSALPDMETEGDHMDDDDDDDGGKKMTIAEAFEDDDIVAEFREEKQNEINKNKPEIEDLNLPGWGTWVGKNLSGLKPKRRRMFFKTPKNMPRKDDKKSNVIINETKEAKVRTHQVSELPFPFTSVSDFESSVRAPLGNNFIPETAHRKLTRPAVITKAGIVIEPMDESQLINVKNKKSTMLKLTL